MESHTAMIFAGGVVSSALESDAAHEWMASRAFYMQFGGVAVSLIAWLWLVTRAFGQSRPWGLASLVLPPASLFFLGRHPRKGIGPLLLFVASLFIAALPAIYTLCVRLDLGPRDVLVNGQRHLTLTGWDRRDYSVLRLEPDVVLLQMANPDVTDATLESITGMKALEELDLNGTQVTDAGLRLLKQLPALTRLRLARTKISDRGFQEALATKDSIMQLDLSGTTVSRDTANAWREARTERRIMQ
jgi:hypothetical protein